MVKPDWGVLQQPTERQFVAVSMPELTSRKRAVAFVQRGVAHRVVVFIEIAGSGIVAAIAGAIFIPDIRTISIMIAGMSADSVNLTGRRNQTIW